MGFMIAYTRNDEGGFDFHCNLEERTCPSPITYRDDGRGLILGEFFGISANPLFSTIHVLRFASCRLMLRIAV